MEIIILTKKRTRIKTDLVYNFKELYIIPRDIFMEDVL
jgi:hypothetical protein